MRLMRAASRVEFTRKINSLTCTGSHMMSGSTDFTVQRAARIVAERSGNMRWIMPRWISRFVEANKRRIISPERVHFRPVMTLDVHPFAIACPRFRIARAKFMALSVLGCAHFPRMSEINGARAPPSRRRRGWDFEGESYETKGLEDGARSKGCIMWNNNARRRRPWVYLQRMGKIKRLAWKWIALSLFIAWEKWARCMWGREERLTWHGAGMAQITRNEDSVALFRREMQKWERKKKKKNAERS